MRKRKVALLVVVMALGGWLIIRGQSRVADLQLPAGADSVEVVDGSSSLKVVPVASQLTASSGESRDWEYLHLFGSLADEPIDLAWALPTEATIDNTLRSVGRYFSGVQVHCRAAECGAVIFYQPAFFGLEEERRQAELMEVISKLELLDSVLQVSPRLGGYVGAGLAVLSHEFPDGTDPASSLGTVIHFKSMKNDEPSLQ